MLCPCATSTEAMTVSIRRPNSEQPGRGCLNIRALSYGVVKIESTTDDGATVLTLQDSGFIMPTCESFFSFFFFRSCGFQGTTSIIFFLKFNFKWSGFVIFKNR